MIEAILWDNDGVLVDTERLFYAVNRDFLFEHGVHLSEREFFDWFLMDNRGAWHLLEARGASAGQIDALRRERNARYGACLAQQDGLAIDGIGTLLASLAPRVAMGVVTSASREHFDIIHRKLDFERHMRFVLAEGDYTHSKPSPEPYLLGLRTLGLPAERCVVVEDSPRGLAAARAANIACIVLRNPMTAHHSFEGAYRVVDSVRELEREIAALL
jgi:beta-phosphoglucomutase-like phosphatase (HAD superfamily)